MEALQSVGVLLIFLICNTLSGFVTTKGTDFMLDGKPFRFAGTNNYYLIYKDQFMVDNVLETAAQKGFKVVRTWGFIDIGFQNGSHSADRNGPIKDGIYFQYFDADTLEPAYNDTNLRKLDYVLYKAASLGLKILITLTNNWSDFGGMDQYLIYGQLQGSSEKYYHDSFYNDSKIIQMYKNYISHIVNRQNYYNNVVYSKDDTIFAWEIANEPRCQGTGGFSSSNTCSSGLYTNNVWAWKITAWVEEISQYIKSIDANHMIATGDEGWYCQNEGCNGNTECDGYYGISTRNNTKVKDISFMSMHLYPTAWGFNAEWANQWIANHTVIAHGLNKPVLLGEYGWQAYNKGSQQPSIYKQWTDTVYSNGTNGDLFWMLDGEADDGEGFWVPNYDGFAIYCVDNSSDPSPPGDPDTCNILAMHASQMESS